MEDRTACIVCGATEAVCADCVRCEDHLGEDECVAVTDLELVLIHRMGREISAEDNERMRKFFSGEAECVIRPRRLR